MTLLVIAFFLVDGVVEIVWAIAGRDNDGWVWLLASGVLSLAVAVLLFAGFPSTAAWAVGLLFGVNLLVTGITLVMVGMKSRRAARGGTPTGERGQGA
ncbi:HdeD family acid-resistance protein [Halorussus caseinilyticus]|uniref:HdeD family acid-resistance protein n=1 Tax=Halorussus caseinilyticus TaxID=3034025 RepID=A0ABD5WN56_9EURY